MKTIILLVLLIPSIASAYTLPQIFTNQTTSRNSAVYDVSSYKTKTLHVYGKYSSAVYMNMSGTVLVKCAATASGPFTVSCNQSQLASTPAVSTTTNAVITWQDAVQFIRIQWTRTKRAINVWLSGSP